VVDAGEKDAVAPFGKPLIVNATAAANEPLGVAVMVLVPFPPCGTLTADGDADSEKSSPPHGDSLKDAIRVRQLKMPFAGMYSFE